MTPRFGEHLQRRFLTLGLFAVISWPAFGAFSYSAAGSFNVGNQLNLFQFTLTATNSITIWTDGYANGGFDPFVGLFDSGYNQIVLNDDDPAGCTGSPVPLGPNNTCLDSFVQTSLVAGTYWVSLTQAGNNPTGGLGDPFQFSPFSADPQVNNPGFACDSVSPGYNFCVPSLFARTFPTWAIHIIGDIDTNVSPFSFQNVDPVSLPEPASGFTSAAGLIFIAWNSLKRARAGRFVTLGKASRPKDL